MKKSFIILQSFFIVLFIAHTNTSMAWFMSKPQTPALIGEKDIEVLKQDFDALVSGHKTVQEMKIAQQIIDLIRNDTAGQKQAAAWQKTLQAIDVASLSSLGDHPQEIQKQIQHSINQTKEHLEFIANKFKTAMASSTNKLPTQQVLDTLLTTMSSLEEKIKQEEKHRLVLEERTKIAEEMIKKSEGMILEKDRFITDLRTEVATLRTTLESTSSYYQTKLDTSNAMLQKTKVELAKTSKELLKTEHHAHKTEAYTKKVELALQEKVQEKEHHIHHLQTQLEALDAHVNTLAQELHSQRKKLEDSQAALGNEWPVLQTLMRMDKSKIG